MQKLLLISLCIVVTTLAKRSAIFNGNSLITGNIPQQSLTNITIEAFVLWNSSQTYSVISSSDGWSTPGAIHFMFTRYSGINYLQVAINGDPDFLTPYPHFGRWAHVAVTRTPTTKCVYINATLAGCHNTSSLIPSVIHPMRIGAWIIDSSASRFLRGQIDFYRVWKRVLSAQELLGSSAGLICDSRDLMLSYNFNELESDSPLSLDSSGNGNFGVNTNVKLTAEANHPQILTPIVQSVPSSHEVYISGLPCLPSGLTCRICPDIQVPAENVFNSVRCRFPDTINGTFSFDLWEGNNNLFQLTGNF